MGELVLDESIPDAHLRNEILWRIPDEEMATLVDGCRQLRTGDDGSHLSLTAHWYTYTREYSPTLLEKTPFRSASLSSRRWAEPSATFDSSTASTAANSGRTLRSTSCRRAGDGTSLVATLAARQRFRGRTTNWPY